MASATPLYLTRAQSRAVDEIATSEYGMRGLVLMENAGRNAAEFIRQVLERRPEIRSGNLVIACGGGNNGGDGLVIARHLANAGFQPEVYLWAPVAKLTPDAAANYAILQKMKSVEIVQWCGAGWSEALIATEKKRPTIAIDALLGTGATGALRTPYDEAITWLNQLGGITFAIDLPSGLDADTGIPASPTVRADYTLTFVSQKIGFATPGAAAYLGEVHVLDIGAPREAISKAAQIA